MNGGRSGTTAMNKRFFTTLAVFAVLLVATNAFVVYRCINDPSRNSYLVAIKDKHRLLEHTASPKTIVIGGSNVAFGINSRLLMDSLHMPVVNMGLHIGVGLRYMLDEVMPFVNAGDIVIVSPEYECFIDRLEGNFVLADLVFTYPRAMLFLRSFGQGGACVKRIPFYWRKTVFGDENAPVTDPVYCRNCFNGQGDLISHLTLPQPDFHEKNVPLRALGMPIDMQAVPLLNRFYADAVRKKARTFFSFTPCERSAFVTDSGLILQLYSLLKKKGRMPILSGPEQMVFNKDRFYITKYHLNAQGREMRTRLLAEEVMQDLEKERMAGVR
jgi:hypothetical protein